MDLQTSRYPNSSEKDREAIVTELGSLYLLNLLTIADNEDEGGLDHPLEAKYAVLQPMIQALQGQGLITTEDYEEDGESGEEYIPTEATGAFFDKLIAQTGKYRDNPLSASQLEAVKQHFYFAMDEGSLQEIDESAGKWYDQIASFAFYENLVPEGEDAVEEPEEEAAPQINEADYEVDAPAAAVPREFRESGSGGDSAFDIQEEVTFQDAPKEYRFKTPAIIHGIIGCVGVVFYLNGWTFGGILAVIFISLAVFYYFKTVTLYGREIELKSFLAKKTIAYGELAETTLEEEDGEAKSLEIVGNNGVSMTISSWLEDYSGFRVLFARIAQGDG